MGGKINHQFSLGKIDEKKEGKRGKRGWFVGYVEELEMKS